MRDVIIVGGGPAGLLAARVLAEQGRDVLVLDARKRIGEGVVCTGIVSKEAFDRFGFSSDSVFNQVQKIRLVSPGGSCLDYTHPEALAFAVDRFKFDNEIGVGARRSGAEILSGSAVEDIRVEPSHAAVRVASDSGSYEVRGAVVILATGVHYRFHRRLGLDVPTSFLRAVQAHVQQIDVPQAHVSIKNRDVTSLYVGRNVAPGGFGWVVPLTEGLCRVGLMTEGDARQCFQSLLARIGNDDAVQGLRIDYKPIAQGLVKRTSADRVIAVGEAAGQIKTTTGGGIYYGLLGAEVAAGVIGEAFQRNDLSAKSLRPYEVRWKRMMAREIRLGHWARRLAGRLGDRDIEKVIHAIKADGFFPFVRKHGRFDWHRQIIFYLLGIPNLRGVLSRGSRFATTKWTRRGSGESRTGNSST